jgi:hypothetical protein
VASLTEKIREHIVVDTSGEDQDTLECRKGHGHVRTRHFTRQLANEISQGKITLPDGTRFTQDDLQLAFQEELIAKTGACVLDQP